MWFHTVSTFDKKFKQGFILFREEKGEEEKEEDERLEFLFDFRKTTGKITALLPRFKKYIAIINLHIERRTMWGI